MKKTVIFLVAGILVSVCAFAAEAPADSQAVTAEPAAEAVSDAAPAPTVDAEAVEAAAPAANADNLEFVSGEVSATDEATKSITIKLYGETENAAKDKTLSVTVDTATDITDGEKDRDFKSLAAGTEVDVEYDPATKKATYIFVY